MILNLPAKLNVFPRGDILHKYGLLSKLEEIHISVIKLIRLLLTSVSSDLHALIYKF